MIDRNNIINWKVLFCIPSFYGSLSWGIWLILYLLKLIKVNNCTYEAFIIYMIVEMCFILSTITAYPIFYKYINNIIIVKETDTIKLSNTRITQILLLFHIIGIFGILHNVNSLIHYYDGFSGYFNILATNAGVIRGDKDLPFTFGTQLSYVGWIAISLSAYAIKNNIIKKYWIILIVFHFLLNLLYLDRTRPFWIIFTTFLMLSLTYKSLSYKYIIKWSGIVIILFISIFSIIADWTGKNYYEDKYDNALFPGIPSEIYAAGVSGFAYFNEMLQKNENISYKPDRLLYPINKALSYFDIVDEPPSPVIEFYDVPFSTNVGTFLEPFYRDGGIGVVFSGIAVYSFGLNIFAAWLLKSRMVFAYYAWANICFISFIGFFTPKIASPPIWLFSVFGISQILYNKYRVSTRTIA